MDSPTKETTQICSNCKKPISLSAFILHEAQCSRRSAVCPKCNEVYLKEKLPAHLEEDHRDVPCEWCNTVVDAAMLEKHKTDCEKQPMQCPFCQLPSPKSELKAHEAVCGTRTESCPRCKTFVKLVDLDLHDDAECTRCLREKYRKEKEQEDLQLATGYVSYPLIQPSLRLRGTNSYHGLHQTSLNDFRRTGQPQAVSNAAVAASRFPEQRAGPSTDVYNFPGDRNAGRAANAANVREDATTKPKNRENHNERIASNSTDDVKRETQEEHENAIPCEYCHELFPSDLYLDHVTFCVARDTVGAERYSVAHDLDDVGGNARNPIVVGDEDDDVTELEGDNRPDPNLARNVAGAIDAAPRRSQSPAEKAGPSEKLVDMIPCEFCHGLIAVYEIEKHQLMCDKRFEFPRTTGYQPRSFNDYGRYESDHRQRQVDPVNISDDEGEGQSHRGANATRLTNQGDRNDARKSEDLFPCQFCNKQLRLDQIKTHQTLCDTCNLAVGGKMGNKQSRGAYLGHRNSAANDQLDRRNYDGASGTRNRVPGDAYSSLRRGLREPMSDSRTGASPVNGIQVNGAGMKYEPLRFPKSIVSGTSTTNRTNPTQSRATNSGASTSHSNASGTNKQGKPLNSRSPGSTSGARPQWK